MRNLVFTGSALAVGALSVLVAVSHPLAHPQQHPPLQADPRPSLEVTDPPATDPRQDPMIAVGGPLVVDKATVDGPVLAAPPLSLTASDGSGLALAELRASAVVEGPLAFTEIHLAFDNPENRVREGTFKITLPQGASLGAVRDEDRRRVARGRGRREGSTRDAPTRTFCTASRTRRSSSAAPATSSPRACSRSRAHGRKELVVSYAQELAGGAPYTLPLRGLPELGELDVSVTGGRRRGAAAAASRARRPARGLRRDERRRIARPSSGAATSSVARCGRWPRRCPIRCVARSSSSTRAPRARWVSPTR